MSKIHGTDFSFKASFEKGSEVFAYLAYLKNEIETAKSSESKEAYLYYMFCFKTLLNVYVEEILNRFSISFDLFESKLVDYSDSLGEDSFVFSCSINSKNYYANDSKVVTASFDRDALKKVGLVLKDGTSVKDMSTYVKYLSENGMEIPNFIHEKTSCVFDKDKASTCDHAFVKRTTKSSIKFN